MTQNVDGENHPIYVARGVGPKVRRISRVGAVDARVPEGFIVAKRLDEVDEEKVKAEYRDLLNEEERESKRLRFELTKTQVFLCSDNPSVRQKVQGQPQRLGKAVEIQQERLALLCYFGEKAGLNTDEEGL